VWELVAGKEPHEDEDQLYVAVKIRDEAYHPAIPENCDPTLRRVMKKCWKMNPDERPVSIMPRLLFDTNLTFFFG
jgi:hypothetical protein